jgi:hypothetical protein
MQPPSSPHNRHGADGSIVLLRRLLRVAVLCLLVRKGATADVFEISYVLEPFDFPAPALRGWFQDPPADNSASPPLALSFVTEIDPSTGLAAETPPLFGTGTLRVDYEHATSLATSTEIMPAMSFGWMLPDHPHTACYGATSLSFWMQRLPASSSVANPSNAPVLPTATLQLVLWDDAHCVWQQRRNRHNNQPLTD